MITQIVKFDIQLDKVDAFKVALLKDQSGSKNENGCLEFRLFQDKKHPNIIFSYERFKGVSALNHHVAQPYSVAILKLLETSAQSEPLIMKLGDTMPAPLHESNPKKQHKEDDTFIIFFTFKVKSGYREKIINQFETHVQSTRAEEEGNIIFDLYTVEGQEETFVVYEHWRKESDVWDIHFNQPYAVQTGKLMHEAVIGEMEQYMNFVKEF